ncbi:MAG TPA: carbohydrate porin [Methylocystis sp.]|nr:carbohydrate porin [Methylocystis sp.]
MLLLSCLFATNARADEAGGSIGTANGGSPWGGFYAGSIISYGVGKSSYSAWPFAWPASGQVALYGQDGQFGPVIGGLQLGYNHVLPSGVLLGVQTSAQVPDKMTNNLPIFYTSNGGSVVNDEIQLFGAVNGRLGYVYRDWLFYATAGFAYDRDHMVSTDGAGDVDLGYVWRAGWTAGGGLEFPLTTNWTAQLEAGFYRFAGKGIYFPTAMTNFNSNLSLFTAHAGLVYQFGADAKPDSDKQRADASLIEGWSIHGQSTVIAQSSPPFYAAYSGPDSLYDGFQVRDTWSMTGYLGLKLVNGTEFYFNPEPFQGFGLSGTHGVGAFPNNEAQKAGYYYPHYYTARLFLRQVFGLGGEQEELADGPNQVASKVDVSRITFTFGKLSIPDIFDNNTYAHDARTTFMNYALVDAGAFDYAGDQKGYSWGSVLELNQRDWAIRTGYFLSPDVSNSNNYDTRVFGRGQYLLEVEQRFSLNDRPTKFRLGAWDNQCYCGSYTATLSDPVLNNGNIDSNAPDIAGTRKSRSEFGFYGNIEHEATEDLGLFARASWRNGQTEVMQFADIDMSFSLGGVLKGASWGRPDDRVGLAGIVGGLSPSYRDFLQAGGLGLQIGDGALSYRAEEVLESYYLLAVNEWLGVTLGYQFISHPAYNAARGPVSVVEGRLHIQF